jgi:uncharacterized protein YsxB (DUF464 family)
MFIKITNLIDLNESSKIDDNVLCKTIKVALNSIAESYSTVIRL